MSGKTKLILGYRSYFYGLQCQRYVVYFAVLITLIPASISAAPGVDHLMHHLALSKPEKDLVFQGKMVAKTVEETSDNELAVGFVFLLPKPPHQLAQVFIEGSKMELSKQIVGHGVLPLDATAVHLAGVVFKPNEKSEVDHYLSAKAGNTLNINKDEVSAFRKLASQKTDNDASRTSVETQLRANLLNRFHAYRKGGLQAVLPYDRGNGEYFPGKDLQRAFNELGFIKELFPNAHQGIASFPSTQNDSFSENFYWVKLISDERPNFVLSHRMAFSEGENQVFFSRHFYASNSYNGQQEVAVLMPFKQGSLVYYSNRTYSDKVGGFGSDVKQAFGKKILSSSLLGLFTKIRGIQ